jgi:predicted aspartyl protease
MGLDATRTPSSPVSHSPCLQVQVNHHPAEALIDSGASDNIISTPFANKAGLTLQPLDTPINLEVADGRPLHVSHQVTAAVSIPVNGLPDTIEEELKMLVAPIQHSDILLGTPWLKSHN